MYEVHCMRYKIFLRYFHAYAFCAIAFHMLALLIAYPHESCSYLPPSWDADEDVPEVNWEYLRTVTAVTTSMVFNFL